MKKSDEHARKIRIELTKLAKGKGAFSVNDLRVILALERIVSRLALDKNLSKHLVYKGGFVLMKVLKSARFTRDLDALGIGIDKDEVRDLVPHVLGRNIDDGLWFGDIKIKELDEQGEYGALRFDSAFQIGTPEGGKTGKLSRIHFDVGFGDKIPSKLRPLQSDSLLTNEKAISWCVYPPEYIFSEKLQTLVVRGSANSRAKDIYDLVLLYPQCTDKSALQKAIEETFAARETKLPSSLHGYAKSLSIQQIEISWNSIQLETEKLDFKTVWGKLLVVLRELDGYLV